MRSSKKFPDGTHRYGDAARDRIKIQSYRDGTETFTEAVKIVDWMKELLKDIPYTETTPGRRKNGKKAK